ncbi:hypothetical protein ACUN22_11945 [Streptomyces anulatus]|uniref:hypothetical protein n=1 Tax=Streptomyces anulatus TaxID=1892 RepID=UPI00403DC62E
MSSEAVDAALDMADCRRDGDEVLDAVVDAVVGTAPLLLGEAGAVASVDPRTAAGLHVACRRSGAHPLLIGPASAEWPALATRDGEEGGAVGPRMNRKITVPALAAVRDPPDP